MPNNSLFIINSPFQALCAIEAVTYYKEEEPEFLVFDCNDSKDKISSLLKSYGYDCNILPFVGTRQLVYSIRNINKRERVYIGDFFSYDQYLVGVLKSYLGASIIYLDDGASTLSLLPPVCRHRSTGLSARSLFYYILDSITWLKGLKKSFFSLYDIGNYIKFKVEKNAFSTLRAADQTKVPGAVYIIGTNSSALNFESISYGELLGKLSEYIRNVFPNTEMYYCPHRRDTNDYQDLIERLSYKIFQTDVSVEVDFVSKKVNPCFIVGFGSTALITLKTIYPACNVGSVHFSLSDEKENAIYRTIEQYYRNHDIDIINL